MKKLFLILTITFSANSFSALWIPDNFVGVEQTGQFRLGLNKKKCEKKNAPLKCSKLKKRYNHKYFKLIDEMVNDYDNPINSKNEAEACADQAECEAKNLIKSCLDSDGRALMAADFSEIYCSKVTGYNQKLSGRKIVAEDAALKSAYLTQKQADKNAETIKNNGRKAIKAALNSAGGWSNLSNVQKTKFAKYLLRNIK